MDNRSDNDYPDRITIIYVTANLIDALSANSGYCGSFVGLLPRGTLLSSIGMEPVTLTWWAWLVIGIILMAAELLLPTGFFLFFFGVGGVVTAFSVLLGLVPSLFAQGLVFIGSSLLCVVLLRKPLLAKFHFRNRTHSVDSLVGETAQALEAIAPQAFGKVELRGSCWSALNTGAVIIAPEVRCRVEKIDGLTLHVRI